MPGREWVLPTGWLGCTWCWSHHMSLVFHSRQHISRNGGISVAKIPKQRKEMGHLHRKGEHLRDPVHVSTYLQRSWVGSYMCISPKERTMIGKQKRKVKFDGFKRTNSLLNSEQKLPEQEAFCYCCWVFKAKNGNGQHITSGCFPHVRLYLKWFAA